MTAMKCGATSEANPAPARWKRMPRVSGTIPPRAVGTPNEMSSRLSSGVFAYAPQSSQ
jgi:hypothetical protein